MFGLDFRLVPAVSSYPCLPLYIVPSASISVPTRTIPTRDCPAHMTRRDSSGSEEIQWGNGHPQSRRNACGRLTTKVLTNSIFKYRSLSLWNDERAIGVLQKTYVSHVLKSLFVIWEPSSNWTMGGHGGIDLKLYEG